MTNSTCNVSPDNYLCKAERINKRIGTCSVRLAVIYLSLRSVGLMVDCIAQIIIKHIPSRRVQYRELNKRSQNAVCFPAKALVIPTSCRLPAGGLCVMASCLLTAE